MLYQSYWKLAISSTSLKVVFLLTCLSVSHVLTIFGLLSQIWTSMDWLVAAENHFPERKQAQTLLHTLYLPLSFIHQDKKTLLLASHCHFHGKNEPIEPTHQKIWKIAWSRRGDLKSCEGSKKGYEGGVKESQKNAAFFGKKAPKKRAGRPISKKRQRGGTSTRRAPITLKPAPDKSTAKTAKENTKMKATPVQV